MNTKPASFVCGVLVSAWLAGFVGCSRKPDPGSVARAELTGTWIVQYSPGAAPSLTPSGLEARLLCFRGNGYLYARGEGGPPVDSVQYRVADTRELGRGESFRLDLYDPVTGAILYRAIARARYVGNSALIPPAQLLLKVSPRGSGGYPTDLDTLNVSNLQWVLGRQPRSADATVPTQQDSTSRGCFG